jgi:tRNA 2-selenouridine synthase SelU
MVMIVADAILETRRRSGRLNAPDQPFSDEQSQRVVHRLQRNRPDLASHDFRHAVGGDVGFASHCAQDSQTLRRNLNAAVAKQLSWIGLHDPQDRSIL